MMYKAYEEGIMLVVLAAPPASFEKSIKFICSTHLCSENASINTHSVMNLDEEILWTGLIYDDIYYCSIYFIRIYTTIYL